MNKINFEFNLLVTLPQKTEYDKDKKYFSCEIIPSIYFIINSNGIEIGFNFLFWSMYIDVFSIK